MNCLQFCMQCLLGLKSILALLPRRCARPCRRGTRCARATCCAPSASTATTSSSPPPACPAASRCAAPSVQLGMTGELASHLWVRMACKAHMGRAEGSSGHPVQRTRHGLDLLLGQAGCVTLPCCISSCSVCSCLASLFVRHAQALFAVTCAGVCNLGCAGGELRDPLPTAGDGGALQAELRGAHSLPSLLCKGCCCEGMGQQYLPVGSVLG